MRIKELNDSSIVIFHSAGIAQLELKDLPDELKSDLNYDEERDHARREILAKQVQERLIKQPTSDPKPRSNEESGNLMSLFGSPPVVQNNVDFRPIYSSLELGTRNQGSRPSCAVFAMVSAIEYLRAKRTGVTEKFSEEYLIWAVLQTLGRGVNGLNGHQESGFDIGFTLLEVAQALRAYGIPLRSQMPYSLFGGMNTDHSPSDAVIESARERSKISAYLVPGRSNSTKIANIIHALNGDKPIVIGLAWPHYNKLAKTALLRKQTPLQGAGHAVTLVGYRCETGRLEDTSFIFRNSWGRDWGAGGYGVIRYEYLEKYLNSALLMEL
ncbi:C1 family peptidase [Puniceicoccaceae bacterium K14]|nr:C1 family peptidase [Puniceicoccaceae bacterium K14]